MKRETTIQVIQLIIIVAIAWVTLWAIFEPDPVEYIPPAVTQEDVDQIFSIAIEKADRVSYELEKELILREVIQEHIEEAQEYDNNSCYGGKTP